MMIGEQLEHKQQQRLQTYLQETTPLKLKVKCAMVFGTRTVLLRLTSKFYPLFGELGGRMQHTC